MQESLAVHDIAVEPTSCPEVLQVQLSRIRRPETDTGAGGLVKVSTEVGFKLRYSGVELCRSAPGADLVEYKLRAVAHHTGRAITNGKPWRRLCRLLEGT